MAFLPPTRAECLRAVGLDDTLPQNLRRALEFDDAVDALPEPGSHDWLGMHDEEGQTFHAFRELCAPADSMTGPICVQPIDDVLVHGGACIEHLIDFAGAFFVREIEVLPALVLPSRSIRSRLDLETGQVQFFAGDILMELAARRRPGALCSLGLTAHDIYPDVFVRFAFGEASPIHRVALCSMARYRPPFREESAGPMPGLMFRRCLRVLCHEVCHMLGMSHCVYARCLMNGSVDVPESDRRPLHLCPVDLRKLQWALGFNVVERYRRLLQFWRGMGDDPEAMWVLKRLRHVLDGWAAPDDALSGTIPTNP
jgi:archaemetzincin